MKTTYTVIYASGEEKRGDIDWPREPTFLAIKGLVEPFLEGEPLEHVNVLNGGVYCDMFVSELGHIRLKEREPLPRNDKATDVYRENWLTQFPSEDPESLPWIAGTAIVFDRKVWF